MERDFLNCIIEYMKNISTHTLTWSVTRVVWANARGHSISTHTLTWSVTKRNSMKRNGLAISTHTLTWSVTDENHHYFITQSNFNSHAHVERDSITDYVETDNVNISTHTLTWSVTFVANKMHGHIIFQLTRSRGA